ncbi:hypothetical protein L3V79_04095 [Thiotrichales bacterium 19S9-12]|nr:hypothetical protein [Thiotrichales bacterium 19S9-11]MCF6811539.1 hypothetical protein [Thiotrichales bacterium 19S9-12]
MGDFAKIAYTGNTSPNANPLILGCSGGEGHNSAAKGHAKDLKKHGIDILDHFPREYNEDTAKNDPLGYNVYCGSYLQNNIPTISSILKFFTYQTTSYPIMPIAERIDEEIKHLQERNKPNESRPYVDVLLDIIIAGYILAAVWNALQKNDEAEMLKRSVNLQEISDKANASIVKSTIFNMLQQAATIQGKKPYTEIISTQAMALPALCDAVIDYNNWVDKYNETAHTSLQKITIHQYFTDLPTEGAIHYFKALNSLNNDQKSVIKLYGVGLDEQTARIHLNNADDFSGIYDIPPKDNPMVRPGFKNLNTSLHNKWHQTNIIKNIKYHDHNKNTHQNITIDADEEIASVMLGSQASLDTIKYIESLARLAKFKKIFVFGGQKDEISNKIDYFINENSDYLNKHSIEIIRLGHLDDTQMQPIMTRSNVIVQRGGGLSTMEQMAMNHHSNQKIFIHHADGNNQETLTSGILWEDGNANKLIGDLGEDKVIKTSPPLFEKDIERLNLKKLDSNLPESPMYAADNQVYKTSGFKARL